MTLNSFLDYGNCQSTTLNFKQALTATKQTWAEAEPSGQSCKVAWLGLAFKVSTRGTQLKAEVAPQQQVSCGTVAVTATRRSNGARFPLKTEA